MLIESLPALPWMRIELTAPEKKLPLMAPFSTTLMIPPPVETLSESPSADPLTVRTPPTRLTLSSWRVSRPSTMAPAASRAARAAPAWGWVLDRSDLQKNLNMTRAPDEGGGQG